jgi:acyl-CoA thioester hydrolase
MTEQRKFLMSLQIPVRWADLDANGHVNNAKYFTYFEQARIAWLESQDAQNTASGHGPVIAQTGCNFLRPIPYPETLEIRVFAGPPGRSSFPTFYEIIGGATGVKYADGQAVMVWVDRSSGKSQPLPETLRYSLVC